MSSHLERFQLPLRQLWPKREANCPCRSHKAKLKPVNCCSHRTWRHFHGRKRTAVKAFPRRKRCFSTSFLSGERGVETLWCFAAHRGTVTCTNFFLFLSGFRLSELCTLVISCHLCIHSIWSSGGFFVFFLPISQEDNYTTTPETLDVEHPEENFSLLSNAFLGGRRPEEWQIIHFARHLKG